jgi:anti-anti-sigma regulatory factor
VRTVRPSGVLDERDALTGADHLCWVYDDPAPFVDAAQRYLAAGLARGERLLCIGDDLAAEFRAGGELFGPLDDLVASGTLAFQTVRDAYDDGRGLSAGQQRQFYEAAVRDARGAGHTGLRVVADVTPLAGSASGRADLVRWEHMADEFIASGSGMVALCAYRRASLDADALADVTAVHPQVHAPQDLPSFRIWFDGARVVLAGTLDTFCCARLARVLAGSPAASGSTVLDLSRLEVVDVAGCRALASWARSLAAHGLRLRVEDPPRSLVRIWQLLGLDGPAPVQFAGVVR